MRHLSLKFLKHKNILISNKKKVTKISTMNTCDKAEEFKGDQNEETEKLTLIFNGEVGHWWKTRTKTQQMFLKGKRNRRGKKAQICKMYSVEQQMITSKEGWT